MKMPGYPCEICRRDGESVRVHADDRVLDFCSKDCARIYMTRNAPMTSAHERAAIIVGGDAAGGYLDRLGKTDLATMTEEEWREFCKVLFEATCAEMKRVADDEIPF